MRSAHFHVMWSAKLQTIFMPFYKHKNYFSMKKNTVFIFFPFLKKYIHKISETSRKKICQEYLQKKQVGNKKKRQVHSTKKKKKKRKNSQRTKIVSAMLFMFAISTTSKLLPFNAPPEKKHSIDCRRLFFFCLTLLFPFLLLLIIISLAVRIVLGIFVSAEE